MADLPEGAQTNEAGQVAVKHIQPRQTLISILGEPKYATAVKANISLTWVAPEDVPVVLAKMGGSNCGGKKKQPQFLLAHEADVRQWTNGGGR